MAFQVPVEEGNEPVNILEEIVWYKVRERLLPSFLLHIIGQQYIIIIPLFVSVLYSSSPFSPSSPRTGPRD